MGASLVDSGVDGCALADSADAVLHLLAGQPEQSSISICISDAAPRYGIALFQMSLRLGP